MKQSAGQKRSPWFWVGVVLFSISALWWLILFLVPGDIGDTILAGVVTTVVPIGIGIYCLRRGSRLRSIQGMSSEQTFATHDIETIDIDRGRIATKRPVVEKVKVTKPTRLKEMIAVFILLGVCGVVFVLMGILSLSQGVSGLGVQEGPTFETTAVVSDREIERRRTEKGAPYEVYYVYLDFSRSRMDAELVDLLSQQQQGIRVRSREVFDHFYVGKHVRVVYHALEAGYTHGGSVAIVTVDGYEPREGIGNLTTPGFEKGENIAVIAIGGFCLALGLVFLVMVLHPRIRAKVWRDKAGHTNKEGLNKSSKPKRYIGQCTNHPDAYAVETCIHCGKIICAECAVFREEDEEIYCISCMEKLFPEISLT